eukprot:2726272-Rhodomonas_salina.1
MLLPPDSARALLSGPDGRCPRPRWLLPALQAPPPRHLRARDRFPTPRESQEASDIDALAQLLPALPALES